MPLASPPALRPRTGAAALERREERRRRLLEASLRLFSTRGFHVTSIDEIVAAARTSKSAFYEFFESKEDCFRQLLEAEGGRLIQAVIAAAAQGSDHRDRLRRGIAAFLAACFRDVRVARLLLVESVGLSPAIEAVRHRLQGRFAEMVEEEVRRAAAADAFYAAADPVAFGRALVGAVNEAGGHFAVAGGAGPARLARELGRIFAP
ncbi:MAG TPA: helix-turn-helix domain-containing protein [Candidatus Acidoferrales bacterium]|nr:helix-turn-helix domain-containing protein [Candidatus Acidoferrales bacterium]